MTRAAAAVKRSAPTTQQGTSTGRPAKTAKTAAAAAAADGQALEPELEWCRPVFELLDFLGDGLRPACASMLRAAAPHALGTKAHERHSYQTTVIDSLSCLCAEALKSRTSALASLEAAVSAFGQEKESAAQRLAAIKSDEEARREAKGAAAARNKNAEEAVSVAEQALEAERKKLEEAKSLAHAVSEASVEFEKALGETWVPLKEGAFPPKEWRARQKSIARASELLAQVAVLASLAAAVPLALKELPQSRSDFAGQAIEHAEAALQEHVASIAAQIESHQAIVAAQTEATEAAEAAVGAAKAELDVTSQAWIEAENVWVEADSAFRDLTSTIGSFRQKDEQLDAELLASKASLEKAKSLAERFEGLRDKSDEQPSDAVAGLPAEVAVEAPAESVPESSADAGGQLPANLAVEAATDSAEAEVCGAASAENSAA